MICEWNQFFWTSFPLVLMNIIGFCTTLRKMLFRAFFLFSLREREFSWFSFSKEKAYSCSFLWRENRSFAMGLIWFLCLKHTIIYIVREIWNIQQNKMCHFHQIRIWFPYFSHFEIDLLYQFKMGFGLYQEKHGVLCIPNQRKKITSRNIQSQWGIRCFTYHFVTPP